MGSDGAIVRRYGRSPLNGQGWPRGGPHGLAGEIPMYHHILISTDGSPLSASAV